MREEVRMKEELIEREMREADRIKEERVERDNGREKERRE